MTVIIDTLNDILTKYKLDIENWFFNKFTKYNPVLNISVDLRVSDYKIAPVDTNIFPAGYNNFTEQSQIYASRLLREYVVNYANCSKILIIAENHTRNLKYIDSLIVLKNIVNNAGFVVEVGICNINQNIELISSTGRVINCLCLTNDNGVLRAGCRFIPDLILVNNDMTSGIPEVLQGLKYQSIMPSLFLGWFNRSKSNHFSIYKKLSKEFCESFNIDPWLISAFFSSCSNICFFNSQGIDDIANEVDVVISKIRNKFQLYSIKEQPYVFVKADNGTYGMGILVAYCGDDILMLNRKKRNKMKKIKDGNVVSSVIIQEGITTREIFNGYVAEPLVYFIGHTPSCYLYRYHSVKDRFSNLNSVGCDFIDISYKQQDILYWNIIGKIAVLAAAIEMHEISNVNVMEQNCLLS
ncbi:glutamate--cysteine ligase [Ehrlichia chaffeensis str. Heartland]|uniref:Glutamate--cysteine ligase n=2 Tax=Ehrlichia chaffeensis TaxID=945 RepID=Q2GHY0_EHRCR|nr:glutamate--cysteine ligase [Ehrlichia chaffeensis str. Arkansas]AHX04079.1 glutamate--cysteine ligase [Ehrlichia chaffeensis str. Heartland]AHX06012.1 glutamate--cysteine ligase [Ehrlichia chaffeensis str. Jax]AHX07002.1 glutamate--cysteine ligase [Ehrlichia chaffeensis str. Liberty]AHX07378.1 glutamate--cysteine ligase [Ehrlichia chaffeensis str. Osceola]AHX08281.1 glutamate--cysteine ligase [Ehrlichia chaffeensis str. Saint Vincent]AHX09182.1 glutamate--cysteine ligase [Ehrlichia chaffee